MMNSGWVNRERLVSSRPEYQESWLSYCGAVAGVISALGIPCDVVDVGGYSSYAFLVCTTEGWTDPSSQTLHNGTVETTPQPVIDLWAQIHRGTESLGVKIEQTWDPVQYRLGWGPPPVENIYRARELFDRVAAEIDRDHPVVVWGLDAPEYGIVKGYTENHYLVSTFRSTLGRADTPIRFDALQAKGGLEALFIEKGKRTAPEEADRIALEGAIQMAEGRPNPFEFTTPSHPIRTEQRYITGPNAYTEWARVLEEGVPGTVIYEYNSYLAACHRESKRIAARFLRRLANTYIDHPYGETLVGASLVYLQAEQQLKRFTTLFPFRDRGDMPVDDCWEGAGILRRLQSIELRAVERMRSAHAQWV